MKSPKISVSSCHYCLLKRTHKFLLTKLLRKDVDTFIRWRVCVCMCACVLVSGSVYLCIEEYSEEQGRPSPQETVLSTRVQHWQTYWSMRIVIYVCNITDSTHCHSCWPSRPKVYPHHRTVCNRWWPKLFHLGTQNLGYTDRSPRQASRSSTQRSRLQDYNFRHSHTAVKWLKQLVYLSVTALEHLRKHNFIPMLILASKKYFRTTYEPFVGLSYAPV